MAPSGIILEPNEKVILATRPLFLWEPLVIIDILLLVLALYFTSTQPTLMVLFLAVFVLLMLWLVVQWIPWSAKWYVLTDRRVITKRGVLNRTQAAMLLDRVQDASISHPFPLSMIRDYGILHLESAGEHAQERLEGGTHVLGVDDPGFRPHITLLHRESVTSPQQTQEAWAELNGARFDCEFAVTGLVIYEEIEGGWRVGGRLRFGRDVS